MLSQFGLVRIHRTAEDAVMNSNVTDNHAGSAVHPHKPTSAIRE